MPISTETFIILESVDSTNNYAMQRVHSGLAKHGDCCFALEQTEGRGRRGRQWLTQMGKNIILSIVTDTHFLQIHEQFYLSAAVSLACADLFKSFANNNTKIKWPNDLYWNDRKAGGVLIENVLKGNIWQWAVIGIGININQTIFAAEAHRAVSLKQITGQSFDPVELGRKLHGLVIRRLDELNGGNFADILAEYNLQLYKKNEKVRLRQQNIVFETTITGVSAYGELQTMDEMERNFAFNEVEWVW